MLSRLSTVQRHFSKLASGEPIIGVCGGVGPMAGVILQNKIIMNTIASKDPEHLTVIHTCDAQNITDRTNYLMTLADPSLPAIQNPGINMATVAINTGKHAREFSKACVVGVPCNTFHAPPIFSMFKSKVEAWNSENSKPGEIGHIQILNMIDLTSEYIKNKGYKVVGKMSTTGTRQQRLYRDPLEKAGIRVVEAKDQAAIHDAIYNPVDGIKALSATSPRVRKIMEEAVKELRAQGAECLILGCTELPIAIPEMNLYDVDMIDPMEVLARALIQNASPLKLKK
jgi:aspartate racemase